MRRASRYARRDASKAAAGARATATCRGAVAGRGPRGGPGRGTCRKRPGGRKHRAGPLFAARGPPANSARASQTLSRPAMPWNSTQLASHSLPLLTEAMPDCSLALAVLALPHSAPFCRPPQRRAPLSGTRDTEANTQTRRAREMDSSKGETTPVNDVYFSVSACQWL